MYLLFDVNETLNDVEFVKGRFTCKIKILSRHSQGTVKANLNEPKFLFLCFIQTIFQQKCKKQEIQSPNFQNV